MEDLTSSNGNVLHQWACASISSLSKPQLQMCASLMVQLLMDADVTEEPVIWRLRLLCLADGDLTRTYIEGQKLLRTLAKSSADLQDVLPLMHCSCCSSLQIPG